MALRLTKRVHHERRVKPLAYALSSGYNQALMVEVLCVAEGIWHLRLVRQNRAYLDKWSIQREQNSCPKSPFDMGYNERINHLTLLSL